MTDYTTYKAEDFLMDGSFLNYCNNVSDDTIFWENFLIHHPEMLTEIKLAKELYFLISIKASGEAKEIAADKLKAAITMGGEQNITSKKSAPVYPLSKKIKKWLPGIAAAAVLIGIIISGTLWYVSPGLKNYNTTVAEFKKASFLQVIKADDNDRKKVQLPDGSVVVLNYGSVLKIGDNYDKTNRWVYLDGEAFFNVMPDKEKPFVVITDKTATSALGTSFKVRNYKGEEISNVMLATGKVKVQAMEHKNNGEDLFLLPGEQATCVQSSLPFKSTFNQDVLQDWRTMNIVFDKANLDKITSTLEFYYGVHVVLQNKPVTEIAFTGKFPGQSLKDVLEAISFTNKFTYSQTKSTISILFK